jgi:hypothetical protein
MFRTLKFRTNFQNLPFLGLFFVIFSSRDFFAVIMQVPRPLKVRGKGMRGVGGAAGKEAYTVQTINIISQVQYFVAHRHRYCFWFTEYMHFFLSTHKLVMQAKAQFGPDYCTSVELICIQESVK